MLTLSFVFSAILWMDNGDTSFTSGRLGMCWGGGQNKWAYRKSPPVSLNFKAGSVISGLLVVDVGHDSLAIAELCWSSCRRQRVQLFRCAFCTKRWSLLFNCRFDWNWLDGIYGSFILVDQSTWNWWMSFGGRRRNWNSASGKGTSETIWKIIWNYKRF